MTSGHFSEKTGDQCEMNGNFASFPIVGNRVRLHAYDVSKTLDTEACLAQLTQEIIVGHSADKSLFNEIKTHIKMSFRIERPTKFVPRLS